MHMIRFDNDGKLVWERQVTNLSEQPRRLRQRRPVRLVVPAPRPAGLRRHATTPPTSASRSPCKNGSCVDIHEGDRMQVVSAAGQRWSAGTTASRWAAATRGRRASCGIRVPSTSSMVCATDNDCRIAQPNPYRTVAAGTCDGTLFGGDLVLAKTRRLLDGVEPGRPGAARALHHRRVRHDDQHRRPARSHPHLVTYGAGKMLLAWAVGLVDAGPGLRRGHRHGRRRASSPSPSEDHATRPSRRTPTAAPPTPPPAPPAPRSRSPESCP